MGSEPVRDWRWEANNLGKACAKKDERIAELEVILNRLLAPGGMKIDAGERAIERLSARVFDRDKRIAELEAMTDQANANTADAILRAEQAERERDEQKALKQKKSASLMLRHAELATAQDRIAELEAESERKQAWIDEAVKSCAAKDCGTRQYRLEQAEKWLEKAERERDEAREERDHFKAWMLWRMKQRGAPSPQIATPNQGGLTFTRKWWFEAALDGEMMNDVRAALGGEVGGGS